MSRIRAPPIGPLFQAKLDEAKEWLMRELARWNVIQDELLARRYKNNFYDEKEIARERRLYEAVAERFLLEDADFGAWQMARDAVGGRRREHGVQLVRRRIRSQRAGGSGARHPVFLRDAQRAVLVRRAACRASEHRRHI